MTVRGKSIYEVYPGNLLRLPWTVITILNAIIEVNAKTILDVGCGCGLVSYEILTKLPHLQLTLLDRDPKALDMAIARLQQFKATFVHADFMEFTASEKFDLCMFNMVLEHIEDPVQILTKAAQLSSYVFSMVPNGWSLHRIIGKEIGAIASITSLNAADLDVGHVRVYTPALLRSHFKQAGLSIIDRGGVFLKPLSNGQMLGWSQETLNLLYRMGRALQSRCAQIWILGRS